MQDPELQYATQILQALCLTQGRGIDAQDLSTALETPIDQKSFEQIIEHLKTLSHNQAWSVYQAKGKVRLVLPEKITQAIYNFEQSKPKRPSQAQLEILALIAFKGPITRGELEAIRGVQVAAYQLNFLKDQGWIRIAGHRDTPGRPVLYALNDKLIEDLGLENAQALQEKLQQIYEKTTQDD